MISYRFVPISSQKGILFLRHPVYYFYLRNANKSAIVMSTTLSTSWFPSQAGDNAIAAQAAIHTP